VELEEHLLPAPVVSYTFGGGMNEAPLIDFGDSTIVQPTPLEPSNNKIVTDEDNELI
jgi:hypothetical protein